MEAKAMSKKRIVAMALVSFLLSMSLPVFAHHGVSVFDATRTVTMKGSVTEWDWSNPHCLLQFDVKNEAGQAVHWIAETQNPAEMLNFGWAKASFKAGDEVTVTLMPAKNGRPFGRVTLVVLPNGKTFPTSKEGLSLKQSDGPQPDNSSKH
jgi:Family of unknown function (DUF6152)